MRIGLTRLMVWCGAACMLLPAVNAVAAQVDMFITIDGIKGEAAGGAIHLTNVVHQMDAASGMATGKRQHNAITITKEVDSASPRFAQALATNETLKTVQIVFQGSGAGASKVAQRIALTNATIVGIRKVGNTEQITLDYQTSEVTWTDGGKTMADDWNVPR